jgi:hypothetical protein
MRPLTWSLFFGTPGSDHAKFNDICKIPRSHPAKTRLACNSCLCFLVPRSFMDVRRAVPFAKSVMERFSGGRLMVKAEEGPIIFSQGLFHPLVLDLFQNGATISRGPTPSAHRVAEIRVHAMSCHALHHRGMCFSYPLLSSCSHQNPQRPAASSHVSIASCHSSGDGCWEHIKAPSTPRISTIIRMNSTFSVSIGGSHDSEDRSFTG